MGIPCFVIFTKKLTQINMSEVQPVRFFKINAASKLPDDIFDNLVAASKLPILHLRQFPEHSGRAVIVGGAPSVEKYYPRIWQLMANKKKSTLFSINCMHRWLVERNLRPNIHVVFEEDIDPTVVIGKPCHKTAYYISSHCPPKLFDYFKGHKTVLWHFYAEELKYQSAIAALFPSEPMIAGGYTTLFRAINIAIVLGYRKFDLFGVDSSFENDDNQHIEGYPTKPSNVGLADVWWGERKFRTTGALAFQAEMIRRFCKENRGKIQFSVYGSGLLPYMLETEPKEVQSESSK